MQRGEPAPREALYRLVLARPSDGPSNINREERMKIFLGIAAILAWVFGAVQFFVPIPFFAPTGIELTPMSATIAQAHGATLFGLGVINWLARNAERKGLIAVLAGNLVVQVLSLVVALRMMSLGVGTAVAPGMVLHIVLGGFFAIFLAKTLKQ
jgi:hypothetical protein